MNIFEHMNQIDNINQEDTNYVFYDSNNNSDNLIMTKQAFWTHNNPWDLENDSDFDGISDAMDYHVGPGAFDSH